MSLNKASILNLFPINATENVKCSLLVDECVGHNSQLLNLSALLLSQVLHGLLGVKTGPGGTVAVNLPLVLPWFQCALECLVRQKQRCFRQKLFIWSCEKNLISLVRLVYLQRKVWFKEYLKKTIRLKSHRTPDSRCFFKCSVFLQKH